ncbi:imidazole glycerol phosphate synthase subunit HisH [Bacillus sp. 1P06AnD]|uniref:imidazole glycerol phosphate synthase subunit HisH n=1 Tax=Bacillus sp. 1P06AnD TaxID=3132208 RepID=UPI00399EEFF1
MIAIVDYGMGNLFSVSKALERLGVDYLITDDAEELDKADGLILPGVGSFKDAMHLLEDTGIAVFLQQYAESGRPLLGICLGMQLLFEESEENGWSKGLSILKGKVQRFSGIDQQGSPYKVPHMGWNNLIFRHPSPILDGCEQGFAYFVHSYYVTGASDETVIAAAEYGVSVPALVGSGNIYGMQFHPEKSSGLGMQLLGNYIQLVEGMVNV